MVTTTSDVLEQHKAGRIRVLATSDRQRSPFLPDVPTFKEAGYDIEGTGWYGVFAPAKTPADVVERLNEAHRRRREDAARSRSGCWPSACSRPARPQPSSAKIQKADSELWAPAVKASGFTPEQ